MLQTGGCVVVKNFWVSTDSLGGERVNSSTNIDLDNALKGTALVSLGLDQVKEVRYTQNKIKPEIFILLGVTAAVVIGAATRNAKHIYPDDRSK
ncbi:hypothetical protein ACFL3H_03365 [Gemmatimonadota bacterium]